jgi:phosphotriesterase-related protein
MSASIQTVTGAISPEQLGRTLMHEHVLVGYAGWDADWIRPGPSRREMISRARAISAATSS